MFQAVKHTSVGVNPRTLRRPLAPFVTLFAMPVVALALAIAAPLAHARAEEFGTAAKARAMLETAVEAMKVDSRKAIADMNAGAPQFRDRDLYPYCGDRKSGLFIAHPSLVGQSMRDLKDVMGKAFGEELYAKGRSGNIERVVYVWPRPDQTTPTMKMVYVTGVGEAICAVGFYR